MLNGPVRAYFDGKDFDKEAVANKIEEDIANLRQQSKLSVKFLTGAFQDLIALVNSL